MVVWGQVGKGTVQLLGGVVGISSILAGAVNTGGLSLFWTTTGALSSTVLGVAGITNIISGLTTTGPTQSTQVTSSINSAQTVMNPGGLVGALINGIAGGDPMAGATTGATLWSTVSGGRAIWTLTTSDTTISLLNGTLGVLRSTDTLAAALANNPSSPVVTIYTAPIQVDGDPGVVPVYVAPVVTPDTLIYSGLGVGGDATAGDGPCALGEACAIVGSLKDN
jgi:hypothetical protein